MVNYLYYRYELSLVLKQLDKMYLYVKLEILFLLDHFMKIVRRNHFHNLFPCFLVIKSFNYVNRRLILLLNYDDLMLN